MRYKTHERTRAYECAGQRRKLTLITSYYTVFSTAPIIFNRNCRRNRESLVFPSSSSPLTFQRSERSIAARNKSFKVVRSAPSLTVHHIQMSRPTPKRTHGLHPDRQEPCHSLHAGMCCDKVGGLSHNPETHQCILSSSGEPAGKSKLQPLVCSFRFYEDDFSASKAVRTGWQNLTFTNAQNKHCRREQ